MCPARRHHIRLSILLMAAILCTSQAEARAITKPPKRKPGNPPVAHLQVTRMAQLPLALRPRLPVRDLGNSPAPVEDGACTQRLTPEIPACLGLRGADELNTATRLRFNFSRLSPGVMPSLPGPCEDMKSLAPCGPVAQNNDQRLADALNQRRHPFAALGLSVDF